MHILKKFTLIVFVSLVFSAAGIAAFPQSAKAGNYNFSYDYTPYKKQCSWVYQWKWVYGKKVKVRVKICK